MEGNRRCDVVDGAFSLFCDLKIEFIELIEVIELLLIEGSSRRLRHKLRGAGGFMLVSI